MLNQPFSPAYGQTQAVPVSATPELIGIDPLAKQVRIYNPNVFIVFVRISDTNDEVPASAVDYPVGPNQSEVITKADTFSALSIVSDGTVVAPSLLKPVYVTPGEGYLSAAMGG